MSDEVYLNGRPAADFELPAIERGRRCERSRDLEQLAGVLTEQRVPPQAGRGTALLPPLGLP